MIPLRSIPTLAIAVAALAAAAWLTLDAQQNRLFAAPAGAVHAHHHAGY